MKRNPTKTTNKIARLLFLIPLLLLAAGCHQEKVQVYQVAQDQDQPQAMQASATPATNPTASDLPPGHPDISAGNPSAQSMPGGIVAPDTSAAPVTWTTPTGWTQVPPSEMRVGSFKITDAGGKRAEVSIVPLPGMAGGDYANVNRWRGQVGLSAAPDDALQSSAETVQAGGQPAQLFDLAGVNVASGETNRIVAAIQHRDGTTWFFKMTGNAGLVEQQKPAFIDLLKTLSFSSQAAQAPLPPGHPDIGDMGGQGQQALPPGHPAIGDMNATAATGPSSHEGQPNWTVPAGWQEVSGGSFLVAKFMIAGDGSASATVNVSQSAGDGGGLMPNVNRWRGQLGLPPANMALSVTFSVPGGQGQSVTIDGTNVQTGKPAEIQAAVITLSDRTYFYKLMGDPNVVNAHKEEFMTFVKGAEY
jgi:hypothetical protein